MVRAGDLTERITLERHDTDSDTWLALETLPTVWAEATSLGDEQFEFRIRYRNDLVDLEAAQPAMRVIYRGRVLELINVIESDRRTDLRLTARGHRVEVGDLGSTARRTTIWP
jgi:head-tail adaptor